MEVEKNLEGLPENFMSHDVRKNFLKKVYSILTVQILFTVFIVLITYNNKEIRSYSIEHSFGIRILCLILFLVFYFLLYFVKRLYPLNFVVLTIFTFFVAINISQSCLRSKPETIQSACLLTFSLFAILTLFAYFNLIDLTQWGSVLYFCVNFVTILTFVLIGIRYIFDIKLNYLFLAIWIILLIISLFYIVYDTQLILGKGANKISEEDYIIAVIMLYIDLMNIFQIILNLKT